MARQRTPNRQNKNSIDQEDDIILVTHIISNNSFKGISFLIDKGKLVCNWKSEYFKFKNRLSYLRRLKKSGSGEFESLQLQYGLLNPELEPTSPDSNDNGWTTELCASLMRRC